MRFCVCLRLLGRAWRQKSIEVVTQWVNQAMKKKSQTFTGKQQMRSIKLTTKSEEKKRNPLSRRSTTEPCRCVTDLSCLTRCNERWKFYFSEAWLGEIKQWESFFFLGGCDTKGFLAMLLHLYASLVGTRDETKMTRLLLLFYLVSGSLAQNNEEGVFPCPSHHVAFELVTGYVFTSPEFILTTRWGKSDKILLFYTK